MVVVVAVVVVAVVVVVDAVVDCVGRRRVRYRRRGYNHTGRVLPIPRG